jgi:hypothetical protein
MAFSHFTSVAHSRFSCDTFLFFPLHPQQGDISGVVAKGDNLKAIAKHQNHVSRSLVAGGSKEGHTMVACF